MSDLICTVCGRSAIGVASSVLGAMSFAYCKECLEQGAEPLPMLTFVINDVGEQDIAEWVKELKSYNEGQYIEWNEIVQHAKKESTDVRPK